MNDNARELKLLLSRAQDCVNMATKKGQACFLPFLSDTSQALLERELRYSRDDVRLVFFGGYDDAGYRCAGFFPSYLFYDDEYDPLNDFPINAVVAKGSGFRHLSHRDFLGSIMALGLKREMMGDVCVADDGFSAVIFCFERTADYLVESFTCAANDKIKCTLVELSDVVIPPKKFESISSTVNSVRVDALVCACFDFSREEAARLVSSGLVAVNHMTCDDKSRSCDEGAVITVRGHGKFVLHKIADRNRRDRLRIVIHKFI